MKVQYRNEELERQITILRDKLSKTKSKERSLDFERSLMLEQDRQRTSEEMNQLKEADSVINDLTELLRKREDEIKTLVEENKQLVMRYV